MSAGRLGSLVVRIGADTREFDRNAKGVKAQMRDMGRSMRAGVAGAAKFGAAIVAAGAAIGAALVSRSMQAIDTQAKLAQSLQTTQATLAGVQRGADMAGISNSQLEQATRQLTNQLGRAAEGSGTAAARLDQMGLSAEELAQMPLDQRLATINQAIRDQIPAWQQATVASEFYGDRAGAAMMRLDPETLAEGARQADALGLALSDVDVVTIERANDSMSTLREIGTGIINRFAVKFAPLIDAIASLLSEMAIESNGFADAIDKAFDIAVTGAGWFADTIQGLRVVFKGLQLLAAAWGSAVMGIVRRAAEGISAFIDSVGRAVNATVEQLNRLPKVDIATIDPIGDSPFMNSIRTMSDVADDQVAQLRGELHDLAMQPMPSGKIKKFVDDATEAAQEASRKTLEAREQMGGVFGGEEQHQEELDQLHEAIDKRLEAIREGFRAEDEVEKLRHEEKMEHLFEALEHERVTLEEFNHLKEQMESEHYERMEEIRRKGLSDLEQLNEKSMRAQVDLVAKEGTNMLAAYGLVNDRMAKTARIAGASQAFAATLVGQAEALKLGWPAGPIAAAKIATKGFGLVAALKSGKGSSGNMSSAGMSGTGEITDSTPVSQTGQQQQSPISVSLSGIDPSQMYSGEQLGQLFEALNQEAGNRGMTFAVSS
ncbi:hypothetical protein CAI21_21970 [Alkalilimnicola ehrlichii]|uniref:Bacteriophage tail tape measure C-terminal domain-containing protein n=1 Tax=Alkalilimnicola ehrlichii TaxID=351052 RepID=A0A3E0WQ96_9GAMM|nr:hypothetical protein [Alkalilimnicola ehrlichii]RFA24345.1 hypothetical protein CAI21_21970 [Alkalilimnicola ehrlichii]RFA35132.1 hypothetical protein CAL65_13580 [Alkalilimnicola ehrlichii]